MTEKKETGFGAAELMKLMKLSGKLTIEWSDWIINRDEIEDKSAKFARKNGREWISVYWIMNGIE